MEPAAATCAAGTLRRASRSITRVYDARLAPAGLTTMQFSILRALERCDRPTPLSALATELVFERTSLYRALEPLARDHLVVRSAGRGRAKQVALTRAGRRRIAQALPLWTAAQDAFLAQFGRSTWSALAAQLVTIVDVARGIPSEET
jgi:DNA-binding MarR family transcriptional regulator